MWLGRRTHRGPCLVRRRARRVPAYAPAQGHLAEVDAALGAAGAAIDRLRPLAVSSDDPEYAATSPACSTKLGVPWRPSTWRGIAAARYEELVSRHPEAFAEHAADSGSPWRRPAESACRIYSLAGGVRLPVSR